MQPEFPGLGPTGLDPPFAASRVRETIIRSNANKQPAIALELQPTTSSAKPPTDDLVKTEHNNLKRKLALFGLQERKVGGDGNCQFRALSDQHFGTQDFHAEVTFRFEIRFELYGF